MLPSNQILHVLSWEIFVWSEVLLPNFSFSKTDMGSSLCSMCSYITKIPPFYREEVAAFSTFPADRGPQDGSGEIGELWIGGPQVGLGYLRCPRWKSCRLYVDFFPANFQPLFWAWRKRLGEKLRKQDDVDPLLFFWWFLLVATVSFQTAARLDCYWCNLRRLANVKEICNRD